SGSGAVYANNSAVVALSNSTGGISITRGGRTYSTFGNGVYAWDIGGDGGSISVVNSGQILAGQTGIWANRLRRGSGGLSGPTNGNIGTSSSHVGVDGIRAWNHGGTGSVSVSGSGNIYSHYTGVYAWNSGTGGITVNLSGNITSEPGFQAVRAKEVGGGSGA